MNSSPTTKPRRNDKSLDAAIGECDSFTLWQGRSRCPSRGQGPKSERQPKLVGPACPWPVRWPFVLSGFQGADSLPACCRCLVSRGLPGGANPRVHRSLFESLDACSCRVYKDRQNTARRPEWYGSLHSGPRCEGFREQSRIFVTSVPPGTPCKIVRRAACTEKLVTARVAC